MPYTDDLTTLISQGLTFGSLYIDPPWEYDNRATRGAARRQYPTMSLDELKALPVSALAAKDAHLHLWTTTSFQRAAFMLIEIWGFAYKSELIWCKDMGPGNYWRVSHEKVLLGVRGNATHFRQHNLRSWFHTSRGKHSRKPDIVRQWIEQASSGPYLELFGREAVEGWTVFGNELPDLLTPGSTTQPRCAWCGEPFPRQRRSGKYCADACKQAAYRERRNVTLLEP